jgi:pimeloyl-ACP methyl ester carboxylesterase
VPLLLIHAFPFDRTLWRAQVAGLQQHYRVIAPDLRGFGRSSEADGSAISMEQYAADLHALLDSLNVKQAVIGGLSMGGYVALAFLAQSPDRVKGLILANTRALPDSEEARQTRLTNATRVRAEGVSFLIDAMSPKMLGPTAKPDMTVMVRSIMARQRSNGMASALLGMAARPDRMALLPFIKVPTLIITGSADALIPPAESEAMHRAITPSTLVTLTDAGHLSNLDKADAFNDALRAFHSKVA